MQIIYINLRYFFFSKGDLLTCNSVRSNVISKDDINQPLKYNEELSLENLNKIKNVKQFLPTNSNMLSKILPTHLVPIATQIVLHDLRIFLSKIYALVSPL